MQIANRLKTLIISASLLMLPCQFLQINAATTLDTSWNGDRLKLLEQAS